MDPGPSGWTIALGIGCLIILTIVAFAVALRVLTSLSRADARLVAERAALLEAARPAPARVLQSDRLGIVEAEAALVQLSLQIEPPTGDSYVATTAWFVQTPGLPQVESGQSVPVLMDATDPSLIYPGAAWATYAWDFVDLGETEAED